MAVDVSDTPTARFRARTKAVRLALGMSHQEVADAISLDRSSFCRLEGGQRGVSLDEAFAISVALGQSLEAMCSPDPLSLVLSL